MLTATRVRADALVVLVGKGLERVKTFADKVIGALALGLLGLLGRLTGFW